MQILGSHLPEVLIERPGMGPKNLHLKPGYSDTYCFRDFPTRNPCSLVAGDGVSVEPILSGRLCRRDQREGNYYKLSLLYHVKNPSLVFFGGSVSQQ